jgi:hypothetical protein
MKTRHSVRTDTQQYTFHAHALTVSIGCRSFTIQCSLLVTAKTLRTAQRFLILGMKFFLIILAPPHSALSSDYREIHHRGSTKRSAELIAGGLPPLFQAISYGICGGQSRVGWDKRSSEYFGLALLHPRSSILSPTLYYLSS